MNNLVQIQHKDEIVITTEQLAKIYGCETSRISENFKRNEDKFEEGKHFYKLEGSELKSFKDQSANCGLVDKHAASFYLWTRRGASRHCKMLGTNQAWEMFDELEETYFRQKDNNVPQLPQTFAEALRLAADQAEQIEKQKAQITAAQPKVEFFDAVAGSKDAIEIGEVAKVLGIKGMGRNNLFTLLRDKKILMNNNHPYQRYIDCGYFRVLEQKYNKPNGDTCINVKTLVFQKGVDYIRKLVNGDKNV